MLLRPWTQAARGGPRASAWAGRAGCGADGVPCRRSIVSCQAARDTIQDRIWINGGRRAFPDFEFHRIEPVSSRKYLDYGRIVDRSGRGSIAEIYSRLHLPASFLETSCPRMEKLCPARHHHGLLAFIKIIFQIYAHSFLRRCLLQYTLPTDLIWRNRSNIILAYFTYVIRIFLILRFFGMSAVPC